MIDAPLPPLRVRPPVRPSTRSEVKRLRTLAFGAALAYEAVWLAMLKERGDLRAVSARTLLVEVAIPLVMAVAAVLAALWRGSKGIGASRSRLMAWALVAPPLFIVATVLGAPADADPESFWPHALRCFLFTATFSLGPIWLVTRAYRHAFVVASAWCVTALFVASAALAAATMSLVCSVGSAAHVLVGHGSVMVLVGIAGAVIGRRIGEA